MSVAVTGRKETPEHRAKISKSLTGYKHSQEAKDNMSDAKKGAKNPRYGKNLSDEHRAKISAALIGNPDISGENGNNWQGGITPIMQHIRQSQPYKNWRILIFKRDNYTCQMCNDRGGSLQAHHIEPVRDNKNTLSIFDVNNGITLCEKCHHLINGKEYDFIEQFKNIVENTNKPN